VEEIRLLGLMEAARRLGLTVDTVRYLADMGAMPVIRDSARRRLFFAADIKALAKRRKANIATKQSKRGL
jgi:excisionase family DNA binding protein